MTAPFALCRRCRLVRSVLLTAIAAVCSAPLYAQSGNFSGTVALSSQLIDRGLAITPVTPVLQGNVAWTSNDGWALGLSAATETRSPGHNSEALAQLAHYWTLSNDWRMQAGLTYYTYPGNARARVFDRVEGSMNWLYRDVLTLGLSAITLTHGNDQQPRGAADLDFHWPLPQHLSLSAGLGVAQRLTSVEGSGYGSYGHPMYGHVYRGADPRSYYGYGHVGLGWTYGPWRVELDRVFTDPDIRRTGMTASPWVGTISWSF